MYGAVTMNNTLCLGLFLGIVYYRGLDWDFSSEVRPLSSLLSPPSRPSPLGAGVVLEGVG